MMSMIAAIGAGLLAVSNECARVGVMMFDRNLLFFDGRRAEEGKLVGMQFVPDIMKSFVPISVDGLFLTQREAVLAVESAIGTHGLALAAPRNAEQMHTSFAEYGLRGITGFRTGVCGWQRKSHCGFWASSHNRGGLIGEKRGWRGWWKRRSRDCFVEGANSSYDILSCKLAEVESSVDLFLALSSVYVDAATLSYVSRVCSCCMYRFTGFHQARDGASLHRTLCTAANEPRAFEASLRVCTSPGVEVRGEHVGHLGRSQCGDDVPGPVFDASSTLALELAVTSEIFDDNRDGNNWSYVMGS